MYKILFPVTTSPFAVSNWQYILKIATKHLQANITLLHVYDGWTPVLTNKQNLAQLETIQQLKYVSKEQHIAQIEKLKKFVIANTAENIRQRLTFKYLIYEGSVSNAILEEELTTDYQLIVCGASTNHARNSLFGNIAIDVLKHAKTPILLLPPTLESKSIERIGYITELDNHYGITLYYILEWARGFNASTEVVQIIQKKEQNQVMEKETRLSSTFKTEISEKRLYFQTIKGNLIKTIIEYLRGDTFDMIVFTLHQPSFFASLFQPNLLKKIASNESIPVLVLRPKKV